MRSWLWWYWWLFFCLFVCLFACHSVIWYLSSSHTLVVLLCLCVCIRAFARVRVRLSLSLSLCCLCVCVVCVCACVCERERAPVVFYFSSLAKRHCNYWLLQRQDLALRDFSWSAYEGPLPLYLVWPAFCFSFISCCFFRMGHTEDTTLVLWCQSPLIQTVGLNYSIFFLFKAIYFLKYFLCSRRDPKIMSLQIMLHT